MVSSLDEVLATSHLPVPTWIHVFWEALGIIIHLNLGLGIDGVIRLERVIERVRVGRRPSSPICLSMGMKADWIVWSLFLVVYRLCALYSTGVLFCGCWRTAFVVFDLSSVNSEAGTVKCEAAFPVVWDGLNDERDPCWMIIRCCFAVNVLGNGKVSWLDGCAGNLG